MNPTLDIDFDAIEREIEAGFINRQRHPSLPLQILNYSQSAQFEWRWNQETLICRGLIVDDQNNIVARPFPKFFSYEQLAGVVPDEPFEAFEKLDGSLGILYQVAGKPQIASRGSFTSNQAQRANQILQQKYSHIKFDPLLTYLFEIIYPENRIVVDYGDTEDLILLAIIETKTGREQAVEAIGMPMVQRYDGIHDFEELRRNQDALREGFVVRFHSGQRVKIKFEEYKRLHKLMTGIGPKQIWEAMRAGGDLSRVIERVPDEYYDWLRSTEQSIRRDYLAIETRAREQFNASPNFATRKEAAIHFQQSEFPSILFAMLDSKDYSDQIWRLVRPDRQAAFRRDEEY